MKKNQNINTNGTLSNNQRTGFKKTVPIYNGIRNEYGMKNVLEGQEYKNGSFTRNSPHDIE